MRLRRSDPATAGIRRVPGARGEQDYVDAHGRPVVDEATLDRIAALAIPPAWQDVWICPDPKGHIQAAGTDDAGRRQYLYHPVWRAQRDAEKFERVLLLAAELPAARRAAGRDLAGAGLTRRRALGAAFRLIDDSALRIGGEAYLRSARTRGLTTLLCRHLSVEGASIALSFPGKGGKQWESTIEDAALAAYLAAVLERRGERARALGWHEGRWHSLDAASVNDYLRRRTGLTTSAKDFRTLRGTLVAAEALALAGTEPTERARIKTIAEAVRQAADVLGNTPAVARASYVDPRVFDAYRQGRTLDVRPRTSRERALIALLG